MRAGDARKMLSIMGRIADERVRRGLSASAPQRQLVLTTKTPAPPARSGGQKATITRISVSNPSRLEYSLASGSAPNGAPLYNGQAKSLVYIPGSGPIIGKESFAMGELTKKYESTNYFYEITLSGTTTFDDPPA